MPWCVAWIRDEDVANPHRERHWCATKNGRRPRGDATSVETRCSRFVYFPVGTENRTPTCVDCREA